MKAIPVFYCPEMSVDSRGYSPSASKPQQVVADWSNSGLAIEIRSFVPSTPNKLAEVHDEGHVRDVLEGRTNNGHGNRIREVSGSCLWTVGSFVATALEAVRNGKVACSPTSGFHHARYDSCSGFCTFNGLIAAACGMISDGRSVALVDCDAHFGDGTEDIIQRLKLADDISHWTYGRDIPCCFAFAAFELQIRQFIDDFVATTEPGQRILFYQAGADVHVDDPLGPGADDGMTDEDMRRRDRLVFNTCRDLEIPVVWNLAGGYQRDPRGGISKVLELHRATMEECVRCFTVAESPKESGVC